MLAGIFPQFMTHSLEVVRIPLEANRLGFETYAADLNPVAVLLNKCNLELAPRWYGHAPVNVASRTQIGGTGNWQGTHGLAAECPPLWLCDLKPCKRKSSFSCSLRFPFLKKKGAANCQRLLGCGLGQFSVLTQRVGLGHRWSIFHASAHEVFFHPCKASCRTTRQIPFRLRLRTLAGPEKETTSGKGARCLFCWCLLQQVTSSRACNQKWCI